MKRRPDLPLYYLAHQQAHPGVPVRIVLAYAGRALDDGSDGDNGKWRMGRQAVYDPRNQTMSPKKRARPPSAILTQRERAARSWTNWMRRRWVSSPGHSRRAPRSAVAPPAPTATYAHPTPRAPISAQYPPPPATDAARRHHSREKSPVSMPHFRFCPRMTHLVHRRQEQESGARVGSG